MGLRCLWKIIYRAKPSAWLKTAKVIHHQAKSPVAVYNKGERINLRGVSDMFGNVWEWCGVDDDIVPKSYITISFKFQSHAEIRGGSFLDNLNIISPFLSSDSLEHKLETKHSDLGFRIAALIDIEFLPKDTVRQLWRCEESSQSFLDFYEGYGSLDSRRFNSHW